MLATVLTYAFLALSTGVLVKTMREALKSDHPLSANR